MEAPMPSAERWWRVSDAWSLRWLAIRGTVLLWCGRLLRDEFMKLAGRSDLREARHRPVPGAPLRRIHTR
jgi:hypothetical protein